MWKTSIAFFSLAGVAVMFMVFVAVLFMIRFMWGWVVPDLFPGAVAQGLVASAIGWGTSIKIALVFAVLSGFKTR
jgi:hypothetical protein